MFEYEKKVKLTVGEYFSIVMSMCKCSPIESQINYYFDGDDFFMHKKGITCRIRFKNDKYKATVKNHNVKHPECSIEVDLMEKTEFEPEIFNAFGLRCQGELATDRIILYKDSDCEMVLDRNSYLGRMDFELEVEYCKGSEQKAKTLIENIAECLVETKQLTCVDEFLSRVGQGGSKSQRFFERLKNLK